MNKLKLVFALLALFLSATANAITVGSFGELDNFATSASRVSGTGGDFAGVDAVSALIGDDLTDGAINIGVDDSFNLGFSGGINNGIGADLVIFDGQFSVDSVFVAINGSEQLIAASSFVDSGLDLMLRNAGNNFSVFGAFLDLSDFGIADGSSIFSLIIRGGGESDILGVSGINGVSPVPVPAAAWLFGSALLGMFGFVRRKKSV